MWVAFDEVAGITFKDKDGVQIMKDYMASGSFSRGRDSIEAKSIHGICRQHKPKRRNVSQNQSPAGTFPGSDDRYSLL